MHLVLAAGTPEPIPFQVLLDGEAPGQQTVSMSVRTDSVSFSEGRLYQLVRQVDGVRDRTLEITFLEPGAEAYVFTFG